MKTIIKLKLLTFLNTIIPKHENRIAFLSHPDYSDNSKAFFEYVLKEKKHDCIWFVSSHEMIKTLAKKQIVAYQKNNLKGFLKFASCKYVISSDFEHLAIKSKTQKHIALNHGMPLKKIGLYLDDIPKSTANTYKKIDFTLATSDFFAEIIKNSFGLSPNNILITGQPRNDYLFNSNCTSYINEMLNLDIHSFKKIIMYIPTFRHHISRNDGDINFNNILNLESYSDNNLNDFLKENNYLLITKLHPSEQAHIKTTNFSNIKMLDSKELINKNITLNEILNLSDLLVTDYSSVYFDYLILNKPLLFINTDESAYSNNRGFVINDIDFYRPGPKISTLESFKIETNMLLNNSRYFNIERDKINNIVNKHCDNNSSERIYNAIFTK